MIIAKENSLTRARIIAGFSIAELARIANVNHSMICRAEAGKGVPGGQDDGLHTPPRHRNFSGRLPDRCAALPYFSPPLCYLVSTSTNHLPNRDGNRGSERSKNKHRSCPFIITV